MSSVDKSRTFAQQHLQLSLSLAPVSIELIPRLTVESGRLPTMTSSPPPASSPPPSSVTQPASEHDFPFSPPLPSRYTIRPVQASDRAACCRLLCHQFMYHNAVDAVYKLPSLSYEVPFHLMWEHCWPDKLSFVIVDTQHNTSPPTADHSTQAADERHVHWPVTEHDHEADVATLDDSNIAGVILNNDGSRQLPWPREEPEFKAAMAWSDDYLLWTQLYHNGDLRVDASHPLHHLYQPITTPSAPPSHRKGEHAHCFLLGVHCRYHGERLASYLTQALYYHARRLGYESMHVEASHPATAHLFQSGVMSNGIVTHRTAPSTVVKKTEGGEEQRRWAVLNDDVVVVYVTIDQSLAFTLLPYPLTVFKLPATTAVPKWALDTAIDFIAITRTRHELSIIAPTSLLPTTTPTDEASTNWRALVIHGPLAFGLVGVLHRVLRVLAAERIGVLAVSTYETDAVLVQEASVNEAVRVLQCEGHRMLFEPVVASTVTASKHVESHADGDTRANGHTSAENGSH